jgi:DNA-binding FadR family transcriptional regulator
MNLEEPDTADFVGLISGRAAEGGLLPGLYSEDEVASRFGMTRRMVRERR